MIPFELKAIVADENNTIGSHTIYLFNKENKIILPIKLTQNATDAILLAKDTRVSPRPHIHDTTKRLVSALDGTVERIIISGYANDIYYAYIRVTKNSNSIDIDAKPSDAICLAIRTEAPIYVEKEVVKKVGINITSEMLA